MPKTPPDWNPADYATVRERVEELRAAFPTARIVTELVSRAEGRVTFCASIYRSREEAEPAATGWASEREGDGEINRAACLENAETSAVGRALANLGFHGTRKRPHPAGGAKSRLVREPVAPDVVHAPADATARDATPRRALQAEADALLDALLLLETAERAGLPPERVRDLRRALTARSVAPSARVRAELELRAWLRERCGGRRP